MAATKDEGLAGDAAQPSEEQGSSDETPHFHGTGCGAQAVLRIEGESYARAYIDRLRDETTRPGELACLLTFLTGEMREGACAALEKALRGVRYG